MQFAIVTKWYLKLITAPKTFVGKQQRICVETLYLC